MKRIIQEPLVHFLLLGAVLFIAFSLMPKSVSSSDGGKIVITQGQLASMLEGFTRTRQRPPTSEEWEGLIRERVREEVYYREALALGLDRDDTIIRRRLQQKMEFVSDDVAAQTAPNDTELNLYLQAHPDKFRLEQQFTFRQLYFNPEKHGVNLARDVAVLLAKLNQAGGDNGWAAMGDPFMLDHDFKDLPAGEITRQFGENFTAKLSALSPGQWHGPIESGFGAHVVFVSQRTEGRVPALADVREAVIRDWSDARRIEAKEKFYQELVKRYTVTVEQPAVAAVKKSSQP